MLYMRVYFSLFFLIITNLIISSISFGFSEYQFTLKHFLGYKLHALEKKRDLYFLTLSSLWMYIYIYMCVCVCVLEEVGFLGAKPIHFPVEQNLQLSPN